MRPLFATLLITTAPLALASEACWERAAEESGISVALLRGIAWTESSMRAYVVNTSHEHITKTRDVGLVGVNTEPRVLQRLGISENDLFDPCTNLRAGARILKEKFERYGTTWEAVGAYNASCTRLKGNACQQARMAYAWKVYQAMHAVPSTARTAPTRHLQHAAAPSEPAILRVSLR